MSNPFLAAAGIADAPTPSPTPAGTGTPSLDPIVDRIATIEGTGQNPRSSSRGVGQFTDPTLLTTYRRHYGNNGQTDAQVLALKDDPQAMRSMLGLLVNDNASALTQHGHDATPGNIYLANHFGAAGAHAILSADPNTPIEQIVGPDVMAANPQLKGRTAGGMAAWTAQRMGDPPASSDMGSPSGPLVATSDAANPAAGNGNRFLALANGEAPRPSGNTDIAPSAEPDEPGLMASAGQWLTQSDPITNAFLNGGDHKKATFGHNLQDNFAGLVHGAAAVPETMLHAAAGAIDLTGYGHNAADALRGYSDYIDRKTSDMANDPNSPAFKSRELAGNIGATWPVSEVRALEAIPALGRAVEARNVATAAGESLPMGQKLAAGLAHYGDMAAQGAAAGGLTSRGEDVGANMAGGALLAPAVGAASEKVLASGSKIGRALKDWSSKGGDDAAAAIPEHSPAAGGVITPNALPVIKAPPGIAQFDDTGAPLVGIDTINGRQVPQYGTPDQPGAQKPTAIDPVAVRQALGSQGAHNGIEATTDLPPAVADHVAKLTAEGVPLDQALREADITYVGAKPTIAAVTRDPMHQQAVNEGAKMVQTPEGRALNAQVASNNAAVNGKMQGLVEQYGGTPAQGEVAETAAKALAKASDEAYGRVPEGETPAPNSVRALYDAADQEAATLKGKSDAATASSQQAADISHAIQAQFDAREELDSAQAAYKTARTTPGTKGAGDVDKARARVEAARANFRQVSDNPPKAPPVKGINAPGYIDISPLRAALNSPELSNPTVEGAKSLRSGVLGLMNDYSGKSDLVNLRQAEKIRQAINGAYDPMGSGVNQHVGELKAVLDKALDDTQAGPAYKKARAAYKAWAQAYENPKGVADLIRRDAVGNFVNADNWRKAENGLVGTLSDKAHAEVVRQLRAIDAKDALSRLKAGMLQPAVNAATRGPADSGGNAVAAGQKFFDVLNKAGMPKLRELFTSQELADIAATGRAANHLHQAMPGTNNTSNTASAAMSSDVGRRMIAGIHGANGKPSHSVGIMAGSSILGGTATVLGHTVAGPAAAIVIPAARLATDALAKRRAAQALAVALTDATDPAGARAAAKLRAVQNADTAHRQALSRGLSRSAAHATSASHQRQRIADMVGGVLTRANDGEADNR